MIANNTLPAICHVVCALVATGIPGINVTDSGTNQASSQHQPMPLPNGYIAYADIGSAYKVHQENVTWIEARRRCTEEGARLAVIDSEKKIEYVLRQEPSSKFTHIGIIRLYDADTWVDVTTALPVSSLPWRRHEPSGVSDCVGVNFKARKLVNYNCFIKDKYVCELPILDKNPIATN